MNLMDIPNTLKGSSKNIKSRILPYSRQYLDKEDIKSVCNVLKSDYLTQGNQVNKFEKLLQKKVGAKFAIAVNSATSALHIACIALDLQKGDALWTVPNTFVASANCGLYCGSTLDFVDIDPDTFNIDVSQLEKKLKNNNLFIALTEREVQLIELLFTEKKPLSKNIILKKIWRYADDADTHTVETHIYRLRKKILDKFSDEKFIANSKLGYSI